MPKHEPMTAKAIGKAIKAKGLQKLKFYCQMCQKQCRDANGFKCHLTSEAHQRQLLLFAENPNRYMNDFSSEFMKDFLHLLKRRYSTKRVFANQVYQEYIKDRNHLHMNSTRWCTLTGFVKWMGRKGICHVDETEKGLFITYIDRDPETMKRQEELAKKDKMAKDDEERQAKLIQNMIERDQRLKEMKKRENGECDDDSNDSTKHQSGSDDDNDDSMDDKAKDIDKEKEKYMLKKENENQKITFSFVAKKPLNETKKGLLSLSNGGSKNTTTTTYSEPEPIAEINGDEKPVFQEPKSVSSKTTTTSIFDTCESSSKRRLSISSTASSIKSFKSSTTSSSSSSTTTKKRSTLDEIIEQQERYKQQRMEKMAKHSTQPTTWLLPRLIVRVVVKDLGPEYYNKKAMIEKVESNQYSAVIKMLDTNDQLMVDEAHLQTVVPKEGSRVIVLKGYYRGRKATIKEIDTRKEEIKLAVDQADAGGRTVSVTFDDVCKFV